MSIPITITFAEYTDSLNNEYSISQYKDCVYYHKNSLYHREDGPAIESPDYQSWYIDGQRHREDGASEIYSKAFKNYYYHGEYIHCKDNEDFIKIIKMKAFL